MKLNLLVIRTSKPEALKNQYELLGLKFDYHQHGNGPFHFASELDGFVFEIYPLKKSKQEADISLRLGFEIENIQTRINDIKNSSWKILKEPSETE